MFTFEIETHRAYPESEPKRWIRVAPTRDTWEALDLKDTDKKVLWANRLHSAFLGSDADFKYVNPDLGDFIVEYNKEVTPEMLELAKEIVASVFRGVI